MDSGPPATHGLMHSESRMRSVVEHVLDGIVTIDSSGRVESFNRAAERMFGYARDEVIGRNASLLMREPDRAGFERRFAEQLQGGDPDALAHSRETVGQRKDGSTFPMAFTLSEFELDGRRHFTGILRDITERRRLEREVAERLDELAEADRQKNEFLAMLAHELRNPLAPMRNSLHLLKMQGSSQEMSQHARDVMERQLQHLVRLVDDLLDLARIIRGQIDLHREQMDLSIAVARAVETAQPTIDAQGHHLDVSLPEPAVWVDADLVRLSQAIANLLTNAAKYTETPSRIALRVTREDGQAVIRVRDAGRGIEPDVLPRVFELFVRGEGNGARPQGGLGIGLTLVRRLVEMHGGTVQAYSGGRGQGSEFVIRMPALAPPARPAAADDIEASDRRPQIATQPAAHRRILVVDDNVDAAESIGMILQLGGYEVRCVYNGQSALDVAPDYHPDAIVLDIGLPGINGYEVARRLREQPEFSRTLLIAVTGYGQEADRRRSDEAGIDHHLTKPVDPEALQALLQRREAG